MAMTIVMLALALQTDEILKRYSDFRPKDEELRVYTLDWARSLDEAKERARKEGRPILLTAIRTLTGYGDLYGGHC